MSISLTIANIPGSLRQSAAVTANAGSAYDTSAASGSAAKHSASATQAVSAQPLSGQSQLTPSFSVVVLELLNDKGAVIATTPTAQQLAAYRNGTATPPS